MITIRRKQCRPSEPTVRPKYQVSFSKQSGSKNSKTTVKLLLQAERAEKELKMSRRFMFNRDLFNSLQRPLPRKEIRIGLRCTLLLSLLSSSDVKA